MFILLFFMFIVIKKNKYAIKNYIYTRHLKTNTDLWGEGGEEKKEKYSEVG